VINFEAIRVIFDYYLEILLKLRKISPQQEHYH